MIRYLETLFGHKKLFAMPLLIGFAASVTLALLQPQNSIATARIWYDFTALAPVSGGITGVTPADGQQQVLTELLHTRAFCAQVYAHSPLKSYLQTLDGYTEAVDTSTAVKAEAKSLLGRGVPVMSDGTLEALAYDIIGKKAVVVAAGPQIVVLSLTLRDEAVAAGTLRAIIDQYMTVVLSDRRTQAQSTVDFWQQQVDQQPERIATDAAAVASYLDQHPELNRPNAIPDATLTKLRNAENLDIDRYTELLGNLDAAKLTLTLDSSTSPAAAGFKVIDPPAAFTVPIGLKKQLFFAFGGLIIGMIVSGVGVVVMTLLDPTIRRAEDVRALGLRVVSSIPRFNDGDRASKASFAGR